VTPGAGVTLLMARHRVGACWAAVVCAVAVEEADVDGSAITVRSRVPELAAASDDWTAALEGCSTPSAKAPGSKRSSPAGRCCD
jgi:hypothetical protein